MRDPSVSCQAPRVAGSASRPGAPCPPVPRLGTRDCMPSFTSSGLLCPPHRITVSISTSPCAAFHLLGAGVRSAAAALQPGRPASLRRAAHHNAANSAAPTGRYPGSARGDPPSPASRRSPRPAVVGRGVKGHYFPSVGCGSEQAAASVADLAAQSSRLCLPTYFSGIELLATTTPWESSTGVQPPATSASNTRCSPLRILHRTHVAGRAVPRITARYLKRTACRGP